MHSGTKGLYLTGAKKGFGLFVPKLNLCIVRWNGKKFLSVLLKSSHTVFKSFCVILMVSVVSWRDYRLRDSMAKTLMIPLLAFNRIEKQM